MLTIGLTGGIGSGKSAATAALEQLGVPVIDADQVAREVVAPGQPALRSIRERFGSVVLDGDGTLDRRALRDIVFRDSQARQDLEAILHPLIRKCMQERLNQLSAPYAVLSIPLLLETGQEELVDRVLVIDCDESTQIRRIRARDHTTTKQARAILDAQCDRQTRLQAADDVIDNSGDLEQLQRQVLSLHLSYLEMAGRRSDDARRGPL